VDRSHRPASCRHRADAGCRPRSVSCAGIIRGGGCGGSPRARRQRLPGTCAVPDDGAPDLVGDGLIDAVVAGVGRRTTGAGSGTRRCGWAAGDRPGDDWSPTGCLERLIYRSLTRDATVLRRRSDLGTDPCWCPVANWLLPTVLLGIVSRCTRCFAHEEEDGGF
jgi:hypothetical protein